MEYSTGKHVKVVCSLNVGDLVRTDGWGYQLDGKDCVVQDIKRSMSQTGFIVKIDKYPDYIDSDWLDIIKP